MPLFPLPLGEVRTRKVANRGALPGFDRGDVLDFWPDIRLEHDINGRLTVYDPTDQNSVQLAIRGSTGKSPRFSMFIAGNSVYSVFMDDGGLKFGPGSAALDTRIQRTAAKVLTVDDTAGGAVTLKVVGALEMAGLTGATAATRYVGATASGAPASGTFALGDHIIDQTGKVWVCTVAGTPGTWTQVGGGAGASGVARLVSPVSISNTETQVLGYTIPANFMVAGTTFRITAYGRLTASIPSGSSIFRCRIGTSSLSGNIPATVTVANNVPAPFRVEMLVTVRTAGAGGTVIGEVSIIGQDPTGVTPFSPAINLSSISATVAVDTTATKIIELTYISGAATTSATFEVASIEVVNAA